MSLTKVTNRVLADNSVGTAQLAAGAVATKLGSEVGPFAFRNKIINGDMRIDQRNAGASILPTSNGAFAVDRWIYYANVFPTLSLQRVLDGPPGFQYSYRATVNTQRTPSVGNIFCFGQNIEGYNVANLNWGTANAKTITVSFWVKTSVTGTYSLFIVNGDPAPAVSNVYVTTFNVTAANVWQYVTFTIPGPVTGNWNKIDSRGLFVGIALGGGSQAITSNLNVWQATTTDNNFMSSTSVQFVNSSVNSTFQITGMQLEEGSYATPFEQRPIGTELALCQRYYWRPNPTGGAGVSTASQANIVNFMITYPTTMRATPQVIDANDPPRFTPYASFLLVSCQPVNGYNISWTALNAEL